MVIKLNIGKILRELRVKSGHTLNAACELLEKREVSIKPSSLSNWESGRREPGIREFFALCDIYKVRDIRHTFTGAAEDILSGLNAHGQRHARRLIDLLYNDVHFTDSPETERKSKIIRLYDIPVSAGLGEFLDDDNFSEIEVSEDELPPGADFAVRASGDSMMPKISDGQILFIKKRDYVEEDEIGIFSLNGDAYCKLMSRGKLISLNPEYSPIKISEDDSFYTFGKVLI